MALRKSHRGHLARHKRAGLKAAHKRGGARKHGVTGARKRSAKVYRGKKMHLRIY